MSYFIRRGQTSFNSRFHNAVHAMHNEGGADYRNSPLVRASRAAALAADAQRAARAIPLATADAYDRSAIMRVALSECRDARARGCVTPWRRLISSALASAWLRAKLTRSLLIGKAH